MIFLYILLIAAAIAFHVYLAIQFGKIADLKLEHGMKGHIIFICLICPPAGWILALALPN